MGVNSVSGGTGNIAYDNPLFTENSVDERGFAHIRSADYCYGQLVALLFLLRLLRECGYNSIQQIAEIQRVRSGNWDYISQSKTIEIVNIILLLLGINLVHRKNNRLLCTAEYFYYFLILICKSNTTVYNKEDYIGFFNGNFCLLAHTIQQLVIAGQLDTAGINHCEFIIKPLGIKIYSVTGDTWKVIYDGQALLANLIEKC